MRVRLDCCTPTSYSGGGAASLVHGPTCERAEQPLSTEERAEWTAKVLHPAGKERLPKGAIPLNTPGGRAAFVTWLFHERGCDCMDCYYVEHHLDDRRDAVTS